MCTYIHMFYDIYIYIGPMMWTIQGLGANERTPKHDQNQGDEDQGPNYVPNRKLVPQLVAVISLGVLFYFYQDVTIRNS